MNGFDLLNNTEALAAAKRAKYPQQCREACTSIASCVSASLWLEGTTTAFGVTSRCWLSSSCTGTTCCYGGFKTFIKKHLATMPPPPPPKPSLPPLLSPPSPPPCPYLFEGRTWPRINESLEQATLATCQARVRRLCTPPPLHSGKMHYFSEETTNRFAKYHSRCLTPIVVAQQLANNSLLPPSTLTTVQVPPRFRTDGHRNSEWSYQPSSLKAALRSKQGCIVYAFGVAGGDEFSNFYSSKGCMVYAFDPTVEHPPCWRSNMTFHSWGLRSVDPLTAKNGNGRGGWSDSRAVWCSQGELLSLGQIMGG